MDFAWEVGKQYTLAVTAYGADISVSAEGKELLRFNDEKEPYLTGAVGVSVQNGSHCSYSGIAIY